MCEKWFFMLWEQGVEGSNPFAPTTKIKELHARNSFFCYICNHFGVLLAIVFERYARR